jgi:zinc transport system ATP-binding protein
MDGACRTNGATVTFEKVTVIREGICILDEVSATVPEGSCTAIVGPNGAGKTTMLLALLGEIPCRGAIRIAGPSGDSPLRIGYVPQRLQFDRGLPLTVLEFMVMGRQRSPLWFGVRPRHRERALSLLRSVDVEKLHNRRIGALSGGELQRVLLALALSRAPDLLVLDEPASGVDLQGARVFCELLENLRCEQGFTQLMVSHDLATVTHHATHVICLNRRVAAQGPPRTALTEKTLAAVFGPHLGLVNSRFLTNGECGWSQASEGKRAGDA